MTEEWLNHYTLNTEHNRKSYRHEVDAGVLEFLRPIVRKGEGDLLEGLSTKITIELPGAAMFSLFHREIPLVTCGLCWDDALQVRVLNPLIATAANLGLVDLEVPATMLVPWLAVLIYPTAVSAMPEIMRMFADAERCLAWAIMEEMAAVG